MNITNEKRERKASNIYKCELYINAFRSITTSVLNTIVSFTY